MASRARRRTRTRGQPSYREESFDSADDDDDYSQSDGEVQPLSSVQRRRLVRQNSIVDSHSDGNARRSPRTRRSQRVTLEEPPLDMESFIVSDEDDEDEEEEADIDSEPEIKVLEQTRKRRAVQITKPIAKRARRTQRHEPSRPTKPRITYTSPKKKQISKSPAERIDSDGVIPPWSTLPYMTLIRIFEYASWSFEETSKARKAWLLSMAFTCKAFCEPALTVLYNRLNASEFRQLQALQESLANQTEESAFDYRAKVQQISLDERMLQHSWNPNDLLTLLPVVSKLDIWSSKDVTRGLAQIASERWYNYPIIFFTELTTKLKSWRLNGMMFKTMDEIKLLYDLMASEHHPLNGLTELTVTNMLITYPQCKARFPVAPGYNDEANFLPFMEKMTSLSKLRLEYCRGFFSYEGSTPRIWGVLPNLNPVGLTTLELYSCLDESEDLRLWLSKHGGLLKRLTIENCSVMNLSFLQDLAAFCPKLKHLYIDILLVDPSLHTRPIKPEFLVLMNQDDIPTWPDTLQSIRLYHLQQWTTDDARVAFQSLVDSASKLTQLRVLEITASVNGDWKSRSSFRDEWKAKFEHIFLRKDVAPPNKHLVSKKAWRMYRTSKQRMESQKEQSSIAGLGRLRERRNGVRYGSSGSGSDDDSGDFNVRNVNQSFGSRPLTLREQTRRSAHQDNNKDPEKELVVQGLCDVVDIRIDNQRPRDMELNEDNFLDPDEHDESDEDYEA